MDAAAQSHAAGLAAGAACLEAALAYLARGWSVLCLCPPDHVGVGKAHAQGCSHPGKRPLANGGAWKEYQGRLPTEEELREWWRRHPNANVGAALGPVSRLVRVDVEGAAAEARLLEVSGGDLPPTCAFRSGRRDGTGRGLLYALADGVEARTSVQGLEAGGELRVQGCGAQTVLPPSRHVDAGVYAWEPGCSPAEIDPAPAPGWLLALLAAPGKNAAAEKVTDGELIPVGRRDKTLTSWAGSMRRRGFGEAAIRAALLAEIEEGRCEEGEKAYGPADAERIARSVARYEPDAYADVTLVLRRTEPSVNGHAVPAEPKDIDPADVATIDDLIRAGSEVRWLWKGWLPAGVLTAIAAPGGTGKTRFCADMLRRIAHGMPWPDGTPTGLPCDSQVLWVVADNHHDEMVTLSQTFGIKDNVRINASRAEPYGGVALDTAEDYALLEARIKAVRPVFVVIDTVGNATDKNLSKQEDAKAFYWPLQVIARKYRCGLFCLTHLNATGQFLGRRVLEKVRVALRMEQPDPKSEKRRLEVFKSNSKKPAALGVVMGDAGNDYDDQPPERPDDEPGRGKGAGGGKQLGPELKEAAAWLADQLKDDHPRRVSVLRDEALKEGIAVGTLYNAKRLLGVEESKSQSVLWWRLG